MNCELIAACVHILSAYDLYPEGEWLDKRHIAVAIEELRHALQEELRKWL